MNLNLNEALESADLLAKGFKEGAGADAAIVLAAEVRRLQDRVEVLEALCVNLDRYEIRHHPLCMAHFGGRCNCALDRVLTQLRGRTGL